MYLLLILGLFLVFFPGDVCVCDKLYDGTEVLQGKLLPEIISLDNYIKVFDSFPLLKYLLNSFIVSLRVMLGQLVVCSLAAYAFVFIPFKGRDFIFFLFISTMMIPWEATMIPIINNPKTRLAQYVSRADVTLFCTGVWDIPASATFQNNSERVA